MFQDVAEKFSKMLVRIFGSRNQRLIRSMLTEVQEINRLEPSMRALTDEELKDRTRQLKERFQEIEDLDALLPESFALCREASRRTLGMRHFDVQILGGMVLHQGMIAEMVTGEGKTLVGTLPVFLNALTGRGVHVVTVNDYLAQRDRDWMASCYEFLGLTIGAIQSEMDSQERLDEYRCDITYGTNNEFGFDYLRDNMKTEIEDQCQKDLHFAVIDEVDSILIDEARTPLIISGPSEEDTDKYYQADKVARRLLQANAPLLREYEQMAPDYEDRDKEYEELKKEFLHYDVREKEQNVIVSDKGQALAEELAGVGSFYTGQNMDWPHHLTQSLRAHEIYRRDKDYLVENGEVIIIDEFTGRKMEGRRWSNGLHQAVEAKENLRIRQESQTLATVTFQNFFKLYEKIAGMTGTAITEAVEFDKIYSLDVVNIPTNRPLIRVTHEDVIYGTSQEKNRALVEDIRSIHSTGRPILVGTVSVEKSEKLSRLLEQEGISHEVLNAKHHEREAQIVANAGQLGSVTIATNMAGRGTDILLGSFESKDLLAHWKRHGLCPESISPSAPPSDLSDRLEDHWFKAFLEEDPGEMSREVIRDRLKQHWSYQVESPLRLGTRVSDLGGLHIIGSERHEARRIDNQLLGRSGRQGDPGSCRFYMALEDDLMRLFASPRVRQMLKGMGMSDGAELQASMLTRAIGTAQKRVEGQNFEIRKNLLEYDEVMNQQRKIIYEQRQQILLGDDLKEMVLEMTEEQVGDAIEAYADVHLHRDEWKLGKLSEWYESKFGEALGRSDLEELSSAEIREKLFGQVRDLHESRAGDIGEDSMRALERFLLLQTIDTRWKDHLHEMDILRSGVSFEGYGGQDPKLVYKKRGYEMFQMMLDSIKDEVTDLLFKLQYTEEMREIDSGIWDISDTQHQELSGFQSNRESFDQAVREDRGDEPVQPIRRDQPKVGRNSLCPCGSGKKYKKCCAG